ncbi:hypothetical protein [Mycolicibacter sinensis]|uniref:hypothetical protein n=1 Tax=Mycolicibacter sinensis (strain JDM601) TaxID=875328 RepID=UPI0007EB5D0A|nr:hypothetical protein [Mycolicibacter sinensis]OBH20794.1 hypothetical protein A5694_15565 [Mycolicibacter sinensis]
MNGDEQQRDDAAELRRLRSEYVRRMEHHPPSTWPSDLFRAVNAVVELHFGSGAARVTPVGRPRLSVVSDTVRP